MTKRQRQLWRLPEVQATALAARLGVLMNLPRWNMWEPGMARTILARLESGKETLAEVEASLRVALGLDAATGTAAALPDGRP